MNEKTYNGWKNRETWNVSLYINDNYFFYSVAKYCNSYREWLDKTEGVRSAYTPDGVRWESRKVSRKEINEMLRELRE